MAGKGSKPGERRGGRKKGTPNRKTTEVAEMCRRIVEDPVYLATLKQRAVEGKIGPMETTLWHYAFGKPREKVDVTVEEAPPILVIDRTHG